MGKTPKEKIRTREQLEEKMDSLTDADSVLKFYREIIDGDVISEHLFDSDVMQAFSELAEAAVIERHNRGIDDPEYHRGLLI